MRRLLSFLFPVFISFTALGSQKNDSLLNVLKKEIKKVSIYDGQKEARIQEFRANLQATSPTDYNSQYQLCSSLYEEYRSYKFDSAYVYTNKMLNLSHLLKDKSKENKAKLNLAFILCSAGMFKQTFDCLNDINASALIPELKFQYYSLKARALIDLADYDSDTYYSQYENTESVKYIDSAIMFSKPNSIEQLMEYGLRQIQVGQLHPPAPSLIKLLKSYKLTEHQRAMIATNLSFYYKDSTENNRRLELLITASINDIRSSTKETLAGLILGEVLYHNGNTADAYSFIQKSMNDAEYYGARLRKIKIGAILPTLAAQRLIQMEKEKNRVQFYLLSIGGMSMSVLLISFIVFIQLKRVKAKEKIIEEKNALLERINQQLNDDAKIKEEYIGYFFNVISGYILKLEKLKRNIERKLVTKKYDDIQLAIDEINIKKERETLFYTFDHTFLKIFPNFISTFNSLFKEEDQIWPKGNEVLNTDLRIFALKRIGISDNETVASILEYSAKTIYVYKMRIKAKSIYPSDQFDQILMSTKVFDVPKEPMPPSGKG